MTVNEAGVAARTLVRAAFFMVMIMGVAGAEAGDPEFEPATDPPPAPEEVEPDGEPLALNPSLAPTVGWSLLRDDDMDATYGGIPWAGVELTAAVGIATDFFILVEYGQASGDPYHDIETFNGPESLLRAVPLTFGLKLNTSRNQRVALLLGIGLQVAWVEEEIPMASPDATDARQSYSGWGMGFMVSLGPEWRSADGGRGFGLDLTWGGSDVEVGPSGDDHQVNTVGAKARLYLRWRL